MATSNSVDALASMLFSVHSDWLASSWFSFNNDLLNNKAFLVSKGKLLFFELPAPRQTNVLSRNVLNATSSAVISTAGKFDPSGHIIRPHQTRMQHLDHT